LNGAKFHGSAVVVDRAALGNFGGLGEAGRFDQQITANRVRRLLERSDGLSLQAREHLATVLQGLTRVQLLALFGFRFDEIESSVI